jgi:hypothetical protein
LVSDPFEIVLNTTDVDPVTTVPRHRLLRNVPNNSVGNRLVTRSPGFDGIC